MPLTSDPAGAVVIDQVTGEHYITPTTAVLRKSSSHTLRFEKEGYQPMIVPLHREARFLWWFLDAWSLGVGNLIDAVTGGLYQIRPTSIHAVMERATETLRSR